MDIIYSFIRDSTSSSSMHQMGKNHSQKHTKKFDKTTCESKKEYFYLELGERTTVIHCQFQ